MTKLQLLLKTAQLTHMACEVLKLKHFELHAKISLVQLARPQKALEHFKAIDKCEELQTTAKHHHDKAMIALAAEVVAFSDKKKSINISLVIK